MGTNYQTELSLEGRRFKVIEFDIYIGLTIYTKLWGLKIVVAILKVAEGSCPLIQFRKIFACTGSFKASCRQICNRFSSFLWFASKRKNCSSPKNQIGDRCLKILK